MIIGTAGHIDHGKTSLVRALTGVDTDRLPEEKQRGISIELGYAYTALPDGELLGFIDVPGHERFVHTMLAGATGIDFALLVVAADDGVMPQTREHLSILDLLGVEHGVVALTKADLATPERHAEVVRQLRQLLAGTPLAAAAIHPVSSLTGQGLDKLRNIFAASAKRCGERPGGGRFRLGADRSFTLPGAGTVVTGTVFSGTVRVGDKLVVAPGGRPVRVRSIHAQNRPADCAGAGQRCALNLAGVSREDIRRGDWVVAKDVLLATDRIDVRLQLLCGEARPLKHWSPAHLHLGATHVTARIALLEGEELPAGKSMFAQLVTSEPIACWHGDRFVLRDSSAQRTIGGGYVLDPFGWPRHRRSPARLALLQALERPSAQAKLSALVEASPCGLDLGRARRAMNLENDAAIVAVPELRRVQTTGQDIGFSAAHWEALRASALAKLADFHAKFPDELGPDSARLRRLAFPQLPAAAHAVLVEDLLAVGEIAKSGSWLYLPQHSIRLSATEEALVQRLLPLIDAGRFDPPWVRDLAAIVREPETKVRMTLLRLSRRGGAFQVVRDLFYTERAIAALADIAARLQDASGAIRAAEFRDRTGLGRKRAIQILEFFDRVGFTRRVRDDRVLRGDSLLVLSASARGAGEKTLQP